MNFQYKIITDLVEPAKVIAAKRPKHPRPMKQKEKPKHQAGEACPDCETGTLQERHIKGKPDKKYLGCSNYPNCKHFEWLQ